MSSIIPPKGGSGTAPPKGTPTTAAVDAAELARLRAIEAAAIDCYGENADDATSDKAFDTLRELVGSSCAAPDNPPAPLDTDEQISRLLQENELLRDAVRKANEFAVKARSHAYDARNAADNVVWATVEGNLKEQLAAK